MFIHGIIQSWINRNKKKKIQTHHIFTMIFKYYFHFNNYILFIKNIYKFLKNKHKEVFYALNRT